MISLDAFLRLPGSISLFSQRQDCIGGLYLHDKVKTSSIVIRSSLSAYLLLNFGLLDDLFQQIDVTGKCFLTGLGQRASG